MKPKTGSLQRPIKLTTSSQLDQEYRKQKFSTAGIKKGISTQTLQNLKGSEDIKATLYQ